MNGTMTKIKRLILAAFLVFLALASVVSISYISAAWYQNKNTVDMETIKGSVIRQYFHCGSGTESDPFVITRPIHYYNLVMLTEKGYFDDTTKYYFQLGYELDGDSSDGLEVYDYDDDGVLQTDENGNAKTTTALNMKYYDSSKGFDNTLIPVGTDSHGFNSEFDGSGLTIKNLDIKTSFTDESGATVTGFYDIGVFGYVTNDADIHDLYLENVNIDVSGASVENVSTHLENSTSTAASAHTLKAGSSSLSSDAITVAYVGYIAGHVEARSNISYTYINNCTISGTAGDNYKNTWGYYGYVQGLADPDDGIDDSGSGDKGDSYSFSMKSNDLYNYLQDLNSGSVTTVKSNGTVGTTSTSTAFSDQMVTRNDPESYKYSYGDGVKMGDTALKYSSSSWVLYGNDPDGHSSYAKNTSSVKYNYAFSKLGYSSSTSSYYDLYYLDTTTGEYVQVPSDSALSPLKASSNPAQGNYLYYNYSKYVFYQVYTDKTVDSYPMYYTSDGENYTELPAGVTLTTLAPGVNATAGSYLYYDATQGKYIYYQITTQDYPVYYQTSEGYAAPLTDTVVTTTAPDDQTTAGKYLYFDKSAGSWSYYTAIDNGTWETYTLYFSCFKFKNYHTNGNTSYYAADNGAGYLGRSTSNSDEATYFALLSEEDLDILQQYLEDPSTLTAKTNCLGLTDISMASSTAYYIYCPKTGNFVQAASSASQYVYTIADANSAAKYNVKSGSAYSSSYSSYYYVQSSDTETYAWNLYEGTSGTTIGSYQYNDAGSMWTVSSAATTNTTYKDNSVTMSDPAVTTGGFFPPEDPEITSDKVTTVNDDDTVTVTYTYTQISYGYLISDGTNYLYYNGSLRSTTNQAIAKSWPWIYSNGALYTVYNSTKYYLTGTVSGWMTRTYTLGVSTSSSVWTLSGNTLYSSANGTFYLQCNNGTWTGTGSRRNATSLTIYEMEIDTDVTVTSVLEPAYQTYQDYYIAGEVTPGDSYPAYYLSDAEAGTYESLTTTNTNAVHLNDSGTAFVYSVPTITATYDVAYYDDSDSTYGSPLRGSNYEVSNSTGSWIYTVTTPATYSSNYNLYYNTGTSDSPEWVEASGTPTWYNSKWSQVVSGDVYISDLFEDYLVAASGTATAYQAKYKTYYTKNSDGSYTKTSVAEGDSLSGLYSTTGYNSNNVDFYGYMTIESDAITMPGYQGDAVLLTTSDVGKPYYGNVTNGSSACIMVKVKNPYYGKSVVDSTTTLGTFTVAYDASVDDIQFTRGRQGTSTGASAVIGKTFQSGMGATGTSAATGLTATVTFANISNCAYCGVDADGNIVAIPNITGSGTSYTDNGGMIDGSGNTVATNQVAYYVLLMGFTKGSGNEVYSIDFQFTADDGSGTEGEEEVPEIDPSSTMFGTVEYRTSPDTNVVGGVGELGLIFKYEQAKGTSNTVTVNYDSSSQTYTMTTSKNTNMKLFVMSNGYKLYTDGTLIRANSDSSASLKGYYAYKPAS